VIYLVTKRRWSERHLWTKSFCFVALANYLCLFFFSVDPTIAGLALNALFDVKMVVRPLLYIILIVFQAIHTFFGIFHENIYELYAIMIVQFFITVIITTRCVELCSTLSTYNLLLVCYGVLFQVLYAIYAMPLLREFSWAFYKKAGADTQYRSKYRKYLQLHVLLKLDLMVSLLSILIYAALSVTSFLRLTFVLSMILISIIHYHIARIGYSEENVPFVVTFWCLSTVLPVFIGFGFWEIGFDKLLSNIVNISILEPHSPEWDFHTYAVFYLISCFTLIMLRVCLVIQGVVVYLHFGEGLKHLEFVKAAKIKNQEVEKTEVKGDDGLTFGDVFRNTYENTDEKRNN